MRAVPNPARVLTDLQAFERSLALRAAIELDLFTKIDEGARTAAAVAAACGASRRGVRILCDYLAAIGHLVKRSGRYLLPLDSRLYLTRNSAAFIGSAAHLLAGDAVVGAFGRLAHAVRHGGASGSRAIIGGETHWVRFARDMAPLAGPVAHVVAANVAARPGQKLRILDVGAGHGLYGLAVAMRHTRAHVFAVDRARVLEAARQNANRLGVRDRYHLIPGDAFTVKFGGPYDLVIVANLAHHFDPPTNTKLFRKCRRALKPSGRLFLVDFVPNENRTAPLPDVAFALTMLATTACGDTYTFRELSRLLRAAGFGRVRRPAMGGLPRWLTVASP